jgi:cation diffusion facilitator family transporter
MKIGRPFEFPEEQRRQIDRARRVSWLSIALIGSAAFFLAVTLGQSEAMKTAWISDLLGLIPPLAILAALRIEQRPPDERFPYGYHRVVALAFLATAVLLSIVGLWLLLDSALKLLHGERPPIGTTIVFGHQIWAGWPMMVALAYAVAVDTLIGWLKRPIAKTLNDRVLEADADMNRADWLSEGAAIVGLLVVGFGHWWGDAAAAAFISLNIVHDGWHNLRQVLGDLMDEMPSKIGMNELEALPKKLCDAAKRLDWVETAAVRLREQGHIVTGEVFVVPRDGVDVVARSEAAADELAKLDWRLHGLLVVPTSRLEHESPPVV